MLSIVHEGIFVGSRTITYAQIYSLLMQTRCMVKAPYVFDELSIRAVS